MRPIGPMIRGAGARRGAGKKGERWELALRAGNCKLQIVNCKLKIC